MELSKSATNISIENSIENSRKKKKQKLERFRKRKRKKEAELMKEKQRKLQLRSRTRSCINKLIKKFKNVLLKLIGNPNSIESSNSYKKMKESPTVSQLQWYINNNAARPILDYVSCGNKKFGEEMEKLTREFFKLDGRKDSGHDACLSESKFEIKSGRYYAKKKEWKWQHLMKGHNYDYVIFVGIEFQRICYFIVPKSKLFKMEYKGKPVISQQGNAEGQGYWTKLMSVSDCEKNFTKLTCLSDLYSFLK